MRRDRFSGLTDAWVDLSRALRDLRGLRADQLTALERAEVEALHAEVRNALRAADGSVE